VRPVRVRLVVAADLDLRAVQLGWRVQDESTDAGAQLQDDGAGPGRPGG
jgi:hypothetical protein